MSDDSSAQKVVVYADYLCPFCYLGRESLETYLDEVDPSPEIEWRPFDIQGQKRGPDGTIDPEVDDGKGEAYFEHVRQNVERLSEEYGVEMQFDLPENVDSWNAQKAALAIERAYDRETFEAFHRAVYAACWRDGRDIGDPDVLADIADETGVDPSDVRDAIDDDALDDELAEHFADARRRGIRGIPTFLYGRRATRGAIPPDQFEQLFAPDD